MFKTTSWAACIPHKGPHPSSADLKSLKMPQIRVALVVFDNVELLDFAGPLEILSVAAVPPFSSRNPPSPPTSTTSPLPDPKRMVFDVSILSKTPTFKTANGKGYTMMRDIDLFSPAGDPANWDVIIMPGGIGSRVEMQDKKLLEWIRSFALSNADMPGGKRKVILSVCTGSLILAATGILDSMKITTHHNARTLVKNLVEEHGGEVEVVEDRIVEQVFRGKGSEDLGTDVITSGGVSSGIDAALYLVKKLAGSECASSTAAWIEYDWKDMY